MNLDSPAAKPLRAVFFLEPLPMLAPMVAAWAQAGHEVAAIVMPYRHNARLGWLMDRLLGMAAPAWSLPDAVSRHASNAAIIRLPQRISWERLSQRMATLNADVLISAFFPRRIPEGLLSVFRHGGVNLHPSRLPHFRGPSPLQHLLLQDAWRQHGGVTLHRMAAALDEGDIIAFSQLTEERYWRDRDALDQALAGAMAELVANAVPAWCHGEVRSMPQPKGAFNWADEAADMTVDACWNVDRLRRLLTFFGRKPGVYIALEEKRIRLGTELTVLGPPIGAPPRRNGNAIEFDLADARVSCRRPSRIASLFGKL